MILEAFINVTGSRDRVLAFVSFTFSLEGERYGMDGLKLIEGTEKFFIAFPSKLHKGDHYHYIFPRTAKARAKLELKAVELWIKGEPILTHAQAAKVHRTYELLREILGDQTLDIPCDLVEPEYEV